MVTALLLLLSLTIFFSGTINIQDYLHWRRSKPFSFISITPSEALAHEHGSVFQCSHWQETLPDVSRIAISFQNLSMIRRVNFDVVMLDDFTGILDLLSPTQLNSLNYDKLLELVRHARKVILVADHLETPALRYFHTRVVDASENTIIYKHLVDLPKREFKFYEHEENSTSQAFEAELTTCLSRSEKKICLIFSSVAEAQRRHDELREQQRKQVCEEVCGEVCSKRCVEYLSKQPNQIWGFFGKKRELRDEEWNGNTCIVFCTGKCLILFVAPRLIFLVLGSIFFCKPHSLRFDEMFIFINGTDGLNAGWFHFSFFAVILICLFLRGAVSNV